MEVFATIQSFNFCHFFCGQCEIEEVKVLLHTIFVNRFRNDNHIILKEETKGCLCSSFSVFFIDLCQNRIGVLELKGIIELVYIVLQSVVKPGITGFFKIDLHIKCYIYLS